MEPFTLECHPPAIAPGPVQNTVPPFPPAQAWPPADSPKPRFHKTLKSWGARSQFSPGHKCSVLYHMWTEAGWPGWLVPWVCGPGRACEYISVL